MGKTIMDVSLLARGILIGFSIAAPVGPIGVLCIRRTLAGGRAAGLVSGMGAACADGLYGLIAAFGIGAVTAALMNVSAPLRIAGGAMLFFIGLSTFRSRA